MKTYNIIKGIASLALSFFLAGTADAADWKLDKTQLAKPGEQDTLRVVLENNSFNFSSFQVDIQLPTGIQPIGNPILSPEMANGQTVSWEAQEGTNTYRCVAYSLSNNEMLAPQGTLFSIPVQLTSSFTSGTVSITEGLLANKKSETMEVTDYNKTVKATIEKKDIVVNVSGLEQMVKEGVEASLTVETIPADLPLTVEYFMDDSCTIAATSADRQKEGTLFVKLSFSGNEDYNSFKKIYTLVLTTKKNIEESAITFPKAAPLVKGQLLSTSLLSEGSASETIENGETIPIPGEFVWTDGNVVVNESGDYSVTFIPQNQMYYNTKEIKVHVNVIQTYLITALSSAGGTIKITGQTEDNLYVEGQSLTLEAVPDANYRLAEWSVDGVAAGNELTQNVTATKDMSYFATFEPIEHTVSWTSEGGGYLEVVGITNGSSVQQGATLQVVATPNAGWQLSELTLNGDSLKGNQVLVEEASTINAVFTQKPVDMYTVSAGTSLNGRLLIYKADGSLIPSGSSVPVNTQIRAVALPNAGYQTEYISYEGTEPLDQNDLHVVKGNVTITAEFGRRMFQLDAVAMNTDNSQASGTIELDTKQAYYGDVVGVQVKATQDGANLLYVLANGKELTYPYEFVVTGDMTITAVFDHRVDIKKEYIMWPYQEYYYNGVSRNFVPFASQTYAGFSFEVSYQRTEDGNGKAIVNGPIEDRAVDAGVYKVLLHRDEDGLYNEFNEAYEEGLTIKKSTIAVTEAPANETVNPSTRPSEGVAFDSSKDGNAMKYVITPESETVKNNYNGTTYYYFLPDAPKATLNVGFSTLRSSDGQGYVRVTNGGLPYDGTNGAVEIAVGTPVTLEAVPADGYKFVKWSDGETENPRDYTVSAAATLTPEFASKSVISVALASNASVYNGAAQTVSLTGNGAAECQVTFFSDEACTQPAILKNAGTYYVRVYRPADAEYKEYDNSNAPFSYTITPATPVITAPTASPILAGETLSKSELMGGHAGIVAGSFAWKTPDEVVTATGEYEVTFTPADPNYASATIKVQVTVQGVSGEEENPDDPKPDTDDPDTPTNIEAVEAQTILTGENQAILIRPAQPMTVSVINMTGSMLYHGDITDVTSIPVGNAGVYIVKMKVGEEESVRKLQVK